MGRHWCAEGGTAVSRRITFIMPHRPHKAVDFAVFDVLARVCRRNKMGDEKGDCRPLTRLVSGYCWGWYDGRVPLRYGAP